MFVLWLLEGHVLQVPYHCPSLWSYVFSQQQNVLFFVTKAGGGSIIAKEGRVVGGKCQESGRASSEQVNITLRVRGLYLSK